MACCRDAGSALVERPEFSAFGLNASESVTPVQGAVVEQVAIGATSEYDRCIISGADIPGNIVVSVQRPFIGGIRGPFSVRPTLPTAALTGRLELELYRDKREVPKARAPQEYGFTSGGLGTGALATQFTIPVWGRSEIDLLVGATVQSVDFAIFVQNSRGVVAGSPLLSAETQLYPLVGTAETLAAGDEANISIGVGGAHFLIFKAISTSVSLAVVAVSLEGRDT